MSAILNDIRSAIAQVHIKSSLLIGLSAWITLSVISGFSPLQAHFNATFGKRIIHVEHVKHGLTLYIRTHLPKTLVAYASDHIEPGSDLWVNENAGIAGERLDEPIKFTSLTEAEEAAPLFAAILADAIVIKTEENYPPFEIISYRVYATPFAPDFGKLEEARLSLSGNQMEVAAPERYEGDITVDVSLFYPKTGSNKSFEFFMRIIADENVQTILNNYIDGKTYTYQFSGAVNTPIVIRPRWYQTGLTFFIEGIKHILSGADHVLFVLLLIIGAHGLKPLIISITGFTLGHSATLISGTLGFAPSSQWFIPLIEVLIALTIIYAGVIAAFKAREQITLWLAVIIGLIHGYGFSFSLGQLLELQGGDLFSKLIYFNLGVEFGQALIVLIVWPFLVFLKNHSLLVRRYGNIAIALPCIFIACFWFVERAMKLI